MNLTRGVNGKCPCPICFVPQEEQADLTKTHESRMAAKTQDIYHQAEAVLTLAEGEEILKEKSAVMIKVCWTAPV